MTKPPVPPLPDTPYWRAFAGRFSGILHWQDFDTLWHKLEGDAENWYVFHPEGDNLPETPAEGAAFRKALEQTRTLVARSARRFTAGAVYVDDPATPAMVKIFAPDNMGASCGTSGVRILPRWIFSRTAPDALPQTAPPDPVGWLARALKR